MKQGGQCFHIPSGGGGPPPCFGPGTVPSALDKDVHAWRSVQWTGSPFAPTPAPVHPAPTPPPAPAAMHECMLLPRMGMVWQAPPSGGRDASKESNGVCGACGIGPGLGQSA
eukprot:gene18971-biopygen14527